MVNSRAWGQCARTGKRMLLSNMVEDGYMPGLLVDPAWHEPRQTDVERPRLFDKVTLTKPAPENNQMNHTVMFPLFSFTTFETIPPLVMNITIKSVTVRIL